MPTDADRCQAVEPQNRHSTGW